MADKQTLQFQIIGYTGIDSFFGAIYTHRRMAKRIAKKAMRTGAPFADSIPGENTLLILVLPDNAYRVVDERGNVEIYKGNLHRIGL